MKRIEDPFAPTPAGFHLRVEQTLNGLEEREMTRRKFTVGLAVALAVMLLTATALAAAVVSGGYIDWNGTYHTNENDPATESEVDIHPNDRPYESIMMLIPDSEYWKVIKNENGECVRESGNCINFYSIDEFSPLVAGTDLPLPNIPEGFVVTCVSIATPAEEKPYEIVGLDEETTLYKYRMTPAVPGMDLDEYYLYFGTGSVEYTDHLMWVHTVPKENISFDGPVIHPSGEVYSEAIEIDGYDKALYVESPDLKRLFLLRDLGDKYLKIDVWAETDLAKEAILDLF